MQFDTIFGYCDGRDLVCHARDGDVTFDRFKHQLATATAALRAQLQSTGAARQLALYCEDSYEFSVLLFAALACNAQVVVPANNKRSTAHTIGDVSLWLGDWPLDNALGLKDLANDGSATVAEAPRKFSGAIQLFTSGSSGEPQRVDKTLAQLLGEMEAQQRHWGSLMEGATVLATVSHQHIYGLLFKVLWPLAQGRAFVSKTYLDVAGLLRDAAQRSPALWIASPAQLSRRIDDWPWQLSSSLRAIFSSGGPLALQDAEAIEQLSGIAPHEIFGSTETGGIAWRNQVAEPRWQPLPGVKVDADTEGLMRVDSPWLDSIFIGQDRVQVEPDGRFHLLGRVDRIVKIEEKRISLTQIETLLESSDWIAEARTVTVQRTRQCVTAAIVLSDAGREKYMREGRAALVRALRLFLAPDLEGVALPRLWRFVDAIPTNQQGKSPRELLMQLFDATPAKMLPRVAKREIAENTARVELQIPADLPCLPGHFGSAPVVPGVVQIDWAMHYGRELLGLTGRFIAMEVIKFKQLLVPGESAVLELEFNPAKNKLEFCFRSDGDDREYSSGKLCFDHG
ncbi:AMP-binding protein [Microbulbifer hainanensis]|uniref:AMP-binding protein n=1 Tax=Microbulbifer hainanensis TaxID=2735675 RepID=UPI001867384C|nr:AMP-binding protein [Microbulbifer hainanensis]